MTQICIFGDSWSYQSWQKAPNMKETSGSLTFQKMFAEHNIVVKNLSVQSCANKDMLYQIKHNIELMINSDLAIVFQTDPIRDIVHRRTFRFIDNFDYSKHSGILDISRWLLIQFYNELAEIQHRTKTPVLLVGGLSCLYSEAVPGNIQTLPMSWSELASPGFMDCFFEWVDFVDLLTLKINNPEEVFKIKKQIQAKNHLWQTSDYFSWCHPSDLGYTIMFDTLLQTIKDKK